MYVQAFPGVEIQLSVTGTLGSDFCLYHFLAVTLGKFLNVPVPLTAHPLTRGSMAVVRNKQFLYIQH